MHKFQQRARISSRSWLSHASLDLTYVGEVHHQCMERQKFRSVRQGQQHRPQQHLDLNAVLSGNLAVSSSNTQGDLVLKIIGDKSAVDEDQELAPVTGP